MAHRRRDAGASERLTPTDLEQARAVREWIRELLSRAAPRPNVGPVRDLAASHSDHLTVGDGGQIGLEKSDPGALADGLFGLPLIIRGLREDRTWSRLRVCAKDECRWAFYDRSRNRHGSWCEMATCGNRLESRELRARRRR